MVILSRREFMVTSSLAFSSSSLLTALTFDQSLPETEFKSLRRHVGIFTGRGGTIGWLASPDALVIVDSQFPETAQICLRGLEQRAKDKIDALINTHHHGDHTAGNVVFGPIAKQIVAHQNVPRLQQRSADSSGTTDSQTYADTTFNDQWKMSVGNETVSAKHYGPGHTGGDIVVFFEAANVAHVGDLVFNHRHPFVDRSSGASVRGWISSLESMAGELLDDTIYIFGHAKVGRSITGRKADLLVQRDYFSAVLEHVEKGIAAGSSRDEVSSLEALPAFGDYVGNPPRLTLANVLGVTYDELMQ